MPCIDFHDAGSPVQASVCALRTHTVRSVVNTVTGTPSVSCTDWLGVNTVREYIEFTLPKTLT
mgnify:CR=1 FL=1